MSDLDTLLISLKKLISTPQATFAAIGLGLFVFLLIMMALAFKAGALSAKLALQDEFRKVRQDALKRSRAVLGGQAGEQVAPYLPRFPCNPADARFVGKPIDFIAFPGAAEGDEIEEILLIEVKTGESQLSQRERQIRNAVEQGRVRYVEYRL